MAVGKRNSKALIDFREDPLLEELRAEIDDHLRELEKDLASEGESAANLRALVDRRFGDVERVLGQCRWERRRELILLRAVTIALLVAIGFAAAVLFFNEQQFETAVTKQLDAFKKRVTADRPAAPMTARISGFVFLGEPDRPAAGARIFVCESQPRSSIQIARLIHSDAKGRFQTGDLPLGCYFLLVPVLDREGRENEMGYAVQGRPLHLYKTGDEARVDLNLDALPLGTLRISVKGEVPETMTLNGRDVPVRLSLYRLGGIEVPWPTETALPQDYEWPLVGRMAERFGNSHHARDPLPPLRYSLSRSSQTIFVPAGRCTLFVYLQEADQPKGKVIAGAMFLQTMIAKGEPYELSLEIPPKFHESSQIDDTGRFLILKAKIKPANPIDEDT